jgi:hypothetical protein
MKTSIGEVFCGRSCCRIAILHLWRPACRRPPHYEEPAEGLGG